jgi:uncharacterized repeat protein (TIGR01451 family)
LVFLGVICSAYNPAHARAARLSAALDANDWPMYLHDPAHSGRTPATVHNTDPLFIQWAYSFGERVEIEAQPIVANGVLYQGVMNGEMHALNANTGQVIWIRSPGGPIAHTAATDGTRVYFGTLDNNVYALNVGDGSLAWTFASGGPVDSAPTVVDGRVFIGSNDGNLYALNASTGAKLWQVETGGPVITSPAVVNGRVYFGSEDLKARCASATNGDVLWETQIYGFSMHNTHPIVSDDGQVVIFFTVKAGASSYVPTEDYPDASSGANPVVTWNTYYHNHPTYRTLFYLSTNDGADLWDYSNQRYVPMPIPYWGLLYPVLHPDGSAYFAAPSGAAGYAFELDHDNRLIRVDLTNGVATQVAGGSMPEFQTRMDEVGRYALAGTGNDVNLYLSSSEDLGVYHLGSKTITGLFGDRDPRSPEYINFGSHVNPLSPLPSLHIRRYAGATSMGAVPATSVPIIANNMAYMTSWGWLYALGPTDHGYNPATSFPARDARLYKETGSQYTYPRGKASTVAEIHSEISQRVTDIIATGVSGPPLNVRWEQPGGEMIYNETPYETFGYDFQVVRALSEAYPFLSASQQTQLKNYLSGYLANTLLNNSDYAYVYNCLYFGETTVRTGIENCGGPNLRTQWFVDNPNFIGQRLYALWIYAKNTGDWASINAHWSLISDQLGRFVDAYDASVGYCVFPMWHAGRLNIGAQIAAAEGVRNMAEHLGDTGTYNQAHTLLNNLLNERVALANFVPNLYDQGVLQPAQLRLNSDGTINHQDIMGPGSPFASNMSPFRGNELNRDTDPAQLNWMENGDYEVDEGVGFMYYAALSGYFPLTDEMSARLRSSLLDKTRLYVNTYEVHDPWWWMSDSGHSTTGSGEHLYHSPTLAWSMFQAKAHILEEDWQTLVCELPEAVSTNSKYDLYRLQDLTTLLEKSGNTAPDLGATTLEVTPPTANSGDTVQFVVTIRNEGGPITSTVFMTDTLPAGFEYVPGSLHASLGNVDAGDAPELHWSGVLNDTAEVTITFEATITLPDDIIQPVNDTALVYSAPVGTLTRTVTILVNSYIFWLPGVMKR